MARLYSRRTPQFVEKDCEGSSIINPIPLLKASAAHVIGSIAIEFLDGGMKTCK